MSSKVNASSSFLIGMTTQHELCCVGFFSHRLNSKFEVKSGFMTFRKDHWEDQMTSGHLYIHLQKKKQIKDGEGQRNCMFLHKAHQGFEDIPF